MFTHTIEGGSLLDGAKVTIDTYRQVFGYVLLVEEDEGHVHVAAQLVGCPLPPEALAALFHGLANDLERAFSQGPDAPPAI